MLFLFFVICISLKKYTRKLVIFKNSTYTKIEKNESNDKFFDFCYNLVMSEYTKTETGLEYKVIRMGDGEKPEATDEVEVHYEGKLEDGTIFDSSYARNEKISFGLNQVISGWTEGLQLMPVGSEFEFKIPANLAYGEQALPGIPAGSTLIFKVELFGIK